MWLLSSWCEHFKCKCASHWSLASFCSMTWTLYWTFTRVPKPANCYCLHNYSPYEPYYISSWLDIWIFCALLPSTFNMFPYVPPCIKQIQLLIYLTMSLRTLIVYVEKYTSFIVLAISTQCFHCYVTPSPSPSWLADAMPAIGFQSASSIVVAETWTTLWTQGKNIQFEKLEQCG